MTRKKNKLLTFFWSLIPGAGEMYLGFLKQGVSLMGGFFLLFAVAGFFQLELLIFLAPVIWFYSFFNVNNLNGLPDDEFYALEDDYLFHVQYLFKDKTLFIKYKKLIAGVLIFFGVFILWNNLSRFVFSYLAPHFSYNEGLFSLLRFIMRSVPQTAIAIVIIVAGIYLIRGKSEDLKHDDYIPSPPYINGPKE